MKAKRINRVPRFQPWGERKMTDFLYPHLSAWKTGRRLQVIKLLAQGLCAKEIALELNISIKTVEYHRAMIYRATGLKNVVELTQFALKHRLIDFSV